MRKSILACAILMIGAAAFAEPKPAKYELAEPLKIGGEGGWDYVTLDDPGLMLYVTRSTHTQVIDTSSGKPVADIAPNGRSHGVALVPKLNRGFISDGK